MNILVYRTSDRYWLLDERSRPPQLDPPAELVFSVTDAHLPPEVAQMLDSAIAQSGILELRQTWADYLFRDCAGWERHKSRATSLMVDA